MIGRPSEEVTSYEEVIEAAMAKIPLLSQEWTNYNVSDPGVTILQNFSAFHVIQENSIREITEMVRRNLLKLMGFTAGVNRPGHVFLIPAPGTPPCYLPMHQRLVAGGTCFETVREESAGQGGLASVWLEENGHKKEVTYLLKSEAAGSVRAFGSENGGDAAVGNGIWLVFEYLPEPGEQLALYFHVEEGKRNPFDREHIPEFARLSWQCFNGDGWMPVETVDETACFLTGGRVIITVPRGARRFRDGTVDGYVVRCRLLKSSYDCPPVIRAVYDGVMEVEQRKTLAAMFRFAGDRAVIPSAIASDGAMEVFVQDVEHGSYRRYKRGEDGTCGRFYRITSDGRGNPVIIIDRISAQDGQSVVVVCWAKDAVNDRNLGTVYGYDDQIMEIENTEQVIPEGFCVMARMRNRDGTEEYRFAAPGLQGEEELGYELLSREGRIRIYHPGYRRECQLYLASCAVTGGGGAENALRPGSRLRGAGLEFVSVSPERGGASCESVEELEQRFTEDLSRHETGVTADDYETLVRQTPGLCIEQVKAWMNDRENRVEIAVKPAGSRSFPGLSDIYKETIRDYLEPRRMAATEIAILGPEYVPIAVSGRIRGKKRFGDCQGIVKRFLEKRFEELSSKAGFGGSIAFHVLYRELEELDCVAEVCDLEASPQREGAVIYGGEIRLDNHCLGYLGNVKMEMIF